MMNMSPGAMKPATPALEQFIGLLSKAPEAFSPEERLMVRNHRRERVDHLVVFFERASSTLPFNLEELKEEVSQWGSEAQVACSMVETGSLGLISASPVMAVQVTGRSRIFYANVGQGDVKTILDSLIRNVPLSEGILGQLVLSGQHPWEGIPLLWSHPFFKSQVRHVLANSGVIDPGSLLDYLAWGGYRSFAKCIRFYTDRDIIGILEQSGLRGRSGSGYPAYLKWTKMLDGYSDRRYVICNADESDPGAYMHRMLLESNPHLVIEGLMIASYAVGASQAYIYTRSRYPLAVEMLQKAIDQLKKAGLIGQDILGSGYSLEIILRKAPGAYVCGEETALIASLEGKRGMPRTKPPYPTTQGLFGKPTLVHNLETLAQLPLIIQKGPEWYRSTGSAQTPGTKLFSLAGKVARLGVAEIPFGKKLELLVNEIGGGSRDEYPLKAVLSGGPAGKFLTTDQLDMVVDFDRFTEAGLVMGSGSLIVMNQSDCMIGFTRSILEFIAQESCGKCIPCREGSRRMLDVFVSLTERAEVSNQLAALDRFKGVTQLSELAEVMQTTSLCGLGKSAPNPVISLLGSFREELEEHLFDRKCRSQVCQKLRQFTIETADCTGCHICFQKCPVQAIVGTPRQVHFILQETCTGCGICYDLCKFNAIRVT